MASSPVINSAIGKNTPRLDGKFNRLSRENRMKAGISLIHSLLWGEKPMVKSC